MNTRSLFFKHVFLRPYEYLTPSQTVTTNEQSLSLAAAGHEGVTITKSHKKEVGEKN